MRTILCVALLASRLAGAQESSQIVTRVTVTDTRGKVLMKDAEYTGSYLGRLMFKNGCCISKFAPESLEPSLIRFLGIDLQEIAAKAKQDAQQRADFGKTYARFVQQQRQAQAAAEERARRQAEQAKALAETRAAEARIARDEWRKDMLAMSGVMQAQATMALANAHLISGNSGGSVMVQSQSAQAWNGHRPHGLHPTLSAQPQSAPAPKPFVPANHHR